MEEVNVMATLLVRSDRNSTLNPWRLLDEMERQMWDWMATPFGFTPLSRLWDRDAEYVPPVDLYETADDVLVTASLPGIDRSKVNIEYRDGTVTVSGEQRAPMPEGDQVTAHYTAIPRYGRFSFTFTLPCEVQGDKAEARYEDGILRIRFPKAEHAKSVRIPVTVAPAIEGKAHKKIEASSKAEEQAK